MRNARRDSHATVLMVKNRGGRSEDLTRIGQHIKPQPNGCWLWNGQTANYGWTFAISSTERQAHRIVYEILIGPIPRGHQLHHTCLAPGCVNPKHLVPLTPAEHKRLHLDLAS